MPSEAEQLSLAVAALEAQRSILGDEVVDTALAPLRARLNQIQSQPGAEQRKVVTVLFADLVGFTAMSEQLDPEDVRDITNQYFTRWNSAIEYFNGTVEKFIGDAVMGVFGLAEASEQDPENAIRAAVEMSARLAELNTLLQQERRLELHMRTGIHTGAVVVSMLGERKGQDFVVVGDTVNLASRLQSAAQPDDILISQDTYRLVRGLFDVEVLDPLSVKGKSEPVQAFRVIRAKPRVFRQALTGLAGSLSPLIGREGVISQLRNLYRTVREQHKSHLVTLLGEPGLGKTRLLYEFDDWMETQPGDYYFFHARGDPGLQKQPFALLHELLANRFQIQDSDLPGQVRSKLEGEVEAVLGASEKSRLQAHFIGRLLGFELGDNSKVEGVEAKQVMERGQVYLEGFFRQLARVELVVLLLEDIHWADDSSLDVLESLFDALADNPLLGLCTARPTLYERRPTWGTALSHHTCLELQPLSDEDSRRLVESILGRLPDLPEILRSRILLNADGNPFYIEEIIRMLIDTGVILPENQAWQVDLSRLDSAHIPATLQEVLQARFDRLSPDEKALIQRAAVVGRVFWDQAVEYIEQAERGSSSHPQTLSLLKRLGERTMILPRQVSAFEDTAEYNFKHSLMRDVTYESLLKRYRRAYHASAARWLAETIERSQRAEELAALVAEHFDLGGESEQAQEWYQRAGIGAVSRYANSEAARLVSRALELTPSEATEKRFELLLLRETVYDRLGERSSQERDLEEMKMLAEASSSPIQLTQVLIRWAHFYESITEYTRTVEFALQAVDSARQTGDPRLINTALLMLATGYWRMYEYTLARQTLTDVLELTREAGSIEQEAESRRQLGIIEELEGNFDRAIEQLQLALALVRQTGDRSSESAILNSLGVVAFDRGDLLEGRSYFEASLAIKLELDNRRLLEITYNNLGTAACLLGDYIAAYEYSDQSLEISRQIKDEEGISISLGVQGIAMLMLGQFERAQVCLEDSLRLFENLDDPTGESGTLAGLGLLHYLSGDVVQAQRYSQRALEHAQVGGTWREQFQATMNLARIASADGHYQASIQLYQNGINLPQDGPVENSWIEAQAGQAQAYMQWNDLQSAHRIVDQILEYLGSENGDLIAVRRLDGMELPFQVLLTCYEVLKAASDARWQKFLAESAAILMDSAEGIRQEEWRKSFLENLPANHRLLAEARGETLEGSE